MKKQSVKWPCPGWCYMYRFRAIFFTIILLVISEA